MRANEFQQLSLSERASYLWDHGEFITSIKYYNYAVSLYVMCGLYIETWYSPQRNEFEKIDILDSKGRFNRYLQEMVLNIEDLE